MDDPILLGLTAFSIGIHFYVIYKMKMRRFYLPIRTSIVGFILFFILVILQGSPGSLYIFYASMSLWSGGFFGLGYAAYVNYKDKKNNSF